MLKVFLPHAYSLLVALVGADAPPPEPEQSIQRCVVETIKVDGIYVIKESWCVWQEGRWLPLNEPEATVKVFGVKPAVAPPIPKHQRRME